MNIKQKLRRHEKNCMRRFMKRITWAFALVYILTLCFYSTALIGTLAHELMHKQYSIDPKAISVNYDGSGVTKAGAFFRHSHEWVYFNGFIVHVFLMLIAVVSLIVLIKQ